MPGRGCSCPTPGRQPCGGCLLCQGTALQQTKIQETVRGVVERVTYHNAANGWSVLRVRPFSAGEKLVTVTVHQMRVFAGATMEFKGAWTEHPRFGRQFRAELATELKPASAAALEKYLGSGLIRGVGPKTARKIVRHFGASTLDVFEHDIDRLLEVPGIAKKKLAAIKEAWHEHRAIRDVMMFLQSHGISTLFAVRIYREYGDRAIAMVSSDPYRLARDFYGIGFFSADRVALSIGFAPDSGMRIAAAIRHVLSASREQGHCFLYQEQIITQVNELLDLRLDERIPPLLEEMERSGRLRVRRMAAEGEPERTLLCYYAKSLYNDEEYVARRLAGRAGAEATSADRDRIRAWLADRGRGRGVALSSEQLSAVAAIAAQRCSVLTGGPGCGKTTTIKTLVSLLRAMGRSIMLAAPTGRAAQRMGEVIGMEARTIHRLLEYQGTGFKRNEENRLRTDFLIIDECSMLDITLTASLLRAVDHATSLLFIGDADQLPSVGAGNVLRDLIASGVVPCHRLTRVFRQASRSRIISAAHRINRGQVPALGSPFKDPSLWTKSDCFFIDSDEATMQQLRFIARVKQRYRTVEAREQEAGSEPELFDIHDLDRDKVPEPFRHVDLAALAAAGSPAEQLRAVARRVHPWSSLYYGLTALDVVRRLYTQWIPKYLPDSEIQVLSPMIRGSLGTANLNRVLQEAVNPPGPERRELTVGERVFRVGDRVIHRRNNYDLGVFNGDIGVITEIDNAQLTCTVSFFPDNRQVTYRREQITELDAAYAITVHKAQGSEFDVVILPLLTQHYRMLYRNLVYTGLTRARRLAIFVGTRRALAMAVANRDTGLRQTALLMLLRQYSDTERGSTAAPSDRH